MSTEPAVWEWIERHPVGRVVAGLVALAWVGLFLAYESGAWPIDVAFFVAVAALTFGLGVLSLLAAVVQYRHRNDKQPPELFHAPRSGLFQSLENYFRWLTPLGFMTGVVFAHFFWH